MFKELRFPATQGGHILEPKVPSEGPWKAG